MSVFTFFTGLGRRLRVIGSVYRNGVQVESPDYDDVFIIVGDADRSSTSSKDFEDKLVLVINYEDLKTAEKEQV